MPEDETNGNRADNGSGSDAGGTTVTLTRKDFQTDQEVRWCPGCGDYSILAAMQLELANLGVRPENLVFVSGIGCAARFPYYMNTYGVHSIHGRAPAVATGIALARPDLDVWVIGGDGDMLSIGGNHLIHALRRNVSLKIIMFNNQIYGLTKGQYSPTSEVGKITKSSPFGSLDTPFNPVSVALAAEATFVARTHDMDRQGMTNAFRRAHAHKGSAFVEIYQNCNVFNDGAFESITAKEVRADMLIELTHGEPIRFGAGRERGVVLNAFGECEIVEVADVGEDRLLVHDETRHDPALAFALSRLSSSPTVPTPVGVFRDVVRPTYEDEMQQQLVNAVERQGPGDLEKLLGTGATWEVD
ncbi:MAG TPA: 2-oxoacid:ferredoxin oxidoreductase subunit beta [Acidimicrobiia bacterium]